MELLRRGEAHCTPPLQAWPRRSLLFLGSHPLRVLCCFLSRPSLPPFGTVWSSLRPSARRSALGPEGSSCGASPTGGGGSQHRALASGLPKADVVCAGVCAGMWLPAGCMCKCLAFPPAEGPLAWHLQAVPLTVAGGGRAPAPTQAAALGLLPTGGPPEQGQAVRRPHSSPWSLSGRPALHPPRPQAP